MAQNETIIRTSPERVFAVLMNTENYGHWVVGSKRVRDTDENWPAVGSRFHHSVGFGPLTVDDHTKIEEIESDRRLQLRAKARPLGTALVTLELEPADGGTRVVMTEDPADTLTALVFNPLTHLLVRGRNVESLRRLKELAEGDSSSASA
jgi:uncharacterized protein YndB with AHSA1/START domain